MLKGIDVSSHQGNINWEVVKNNIDFAILRCGYGDNIERQDDTQFKNNVEGCIRNNIPFGVYIYSYATNLGGEGSIQSEVDHTLRLIRGLSVKPFCVYIDMEDDSTTKLGKTLLTDFALEFCKQITNAGYKAGVYANENWCKNYLNVATIESFGYSIWCAKYSSNQPNIASGYDIWQYGDNGKIGGINDNYVDMNYMVKDIRNSIINKNTSPSTTNNNVNVYYRVKTQKHGWLSEVKNLEDYAGYENSPIVGVAIKVDKGSVKYRVHIKGGQWLPYVTGYDINNSMNGWAGNYLPIDLIEVYYNTPNDIRPYKKAKYKVNNYSWQYDNERKNKQDGYGGVIGVNAVKFQIVIE